MYNHLEVRLNLLRNKKKDLMSHKFSPVFYDRMLSHRKVRAAFKYETKFLVDTNFSF